MVVKPAIANNVHLVLGAVLSAQEQASSPIGLFSQFRIKAAVGFMVSETVPYYANLRMPGYTIPLSNTSPVFFAFHRLLNGSLIF